MKIGIITHYNVHNHGAQLQMYGLISQLREMGAICNALEFKKNYDFLTPGIENKYNISLKSIPIYIKYLIKNGLKRTFYNFRKRNILAKFRQKESLIGEYYTKSSGLNVVVLGSDEIFSIEPGLNPCFWGMGVPCQKIISYAASFGPTDESFISEHYAKEFISAGIKRISYLSVRDGNSFDICSKRTNKPVYLVCDPVILYDFQTHLKYKPISLKKKYCIIYSYDDKMNDSETILAIRNFAKIRRLEIISVGYFHKWCNRNIQVNPLDIFSWFAGAEVVFTDTFHGSVLSLVTNTDFFAHVSGNANKLDFLLNEYGVSDRKVNSFREVNERSFTNINYGPINQIIVRKRREAIDFLRRSVFSNDEE